jgi:hypothetical protein
LISAARENRSGEIRIDDGAELPRITRLLIASMSIAW